MDWIVAPDGYCPGMVHPNRSPGDTWHYPNAGNHPIMILTRSTIASPEVAMFRAILVPLDGSALAERALPLALSIAGRSGAHLTLLQVVPLVAEPLAVEGAVLSVAEQLEFLQKRAREYLAELVRRLPPFPAAKEEPVSVQPDTTIGQPALEITNYAAAVRSDLIVVATHGHSGLRRWALGSVTNKVLQLTRLPMLIIRPQAEGPVRFDQLPSLDRIMITLDGSALAESVLPVVTELAYLFDSEVVLFRAVVPLPTPSSARDPGNQDLVRGTKSVNEIAASEARRYLQSVATNLETQGLKVHTLVALSEAADAIRTVAKESGVDLIAMATHGHTGLNDVVWGSVTDRTVRSSPCPVLVVRPSMGDPASAGRREHG